jgi:hypothetical protein
MRKWGNGGKILIRGFFSFAFFFYSSSSQMQKWRNGGKILRRGFFSSPFSSSSFSSQIQKLGNGGKISIRGFFFLFFPNVKMRKWRKNSYKRFLLLLLCLFLFGLLGLLHFHLLYRLFVFIIFSPLPPKWSVGTACYSKYCGCSKCLLHRGTELQSTQECYALLGFLRLANNIPSGKNFKLRLAYPVHCYPPPRILYVEKENIAEVERCYSFLLFLLFYLSP